MNAVWELDVHGMTQSQALTAVDAALRRANAGVYRLRVIHGYHGGTVLREAIRSRYAAHPKVLRLELGLNPGETDLVLREF
jgi:DNA-nicking Smr family endonuclease